MHAAPSASARETDARRPAEAAAGQAPGSRRPPAQSAGARRPAAPSTPPPTAGCSRRGRARPGWRPAGEAQGGQARGAGEGQCQPVSRAAHAHQRSHPTKPLAALHCAPGLRCAPGRPGRATWASRRSMARSPRSAAVSSGRSRCASSSCTVPVRSTAAPRCGQAGAPDGGRSGGGWRVRVRPGRRACAGCSTPQGSHLGQHQHGLVAAAHHRPVQRAAGRLVQARGQRWLRARASRSTDAPAPGCSAGAPRAARSPGAQLIRQVDDGARIQQRPQRGQLAMAGRRHERAQAVGAPLRRQGWGVGRQSGGLWAAGARGQAAAGMLGLRRRRAPTAGKVGYLPPADGPCLG